MSLCTRMCVPAAGCGFSECPVRVYWRPCPAADPLGHCMLRRLLQNWQDEIEKLKTGCGGHEKPLIKTTLSGKETNSITNSGQSPLCWGLRDRCSPTQDPLGWDSQGPTAYSGLRALPPKRIDIDLVFCPLSGTNHIDWAPISAIHLFSLSSFSLSFSPLPPHPLTQCLSVSVSVLGLYFL